MSPTPASDLFDHFRVELDAGDKPLFRGGERITGNVKIQLKREVVIQVIRIQFKGRAFQKDSKKGRDVEKIFFDKDYVLLERPPGNPEPGNFSWKADFEYSLPFQYILPLGCPSSFEGPDGFVRYFSRVTFETSESKSVYVAKKYFSVYDLDTTAAIDPRYQEPYTYRHTFSSGGCCCKRQVYMEFIMPKRVFYSGEDIEGQMIIDNIGDEKIANDIQYNIVERTVKPEINEEDALKYPARVIKSARIDGANVEKRKNQIVIGSILIPAGAPVSLPNAVALAALPRDKTSPQLSPDDQASKLFEHESIISQSRKEPIFRVHYALQLLIGKFILEIPIAIRPVESEDVRNTLKNRTSDSVQLTTAQVAEKRQNAKEAGKIAEQFTEPDEHDKIFADSAPITFSPIIPVYSVRPSDDHQYTWPQLGTFGTNNKLIWHPENKLTKEEKSAKSRQAKEDKEAKKRQKLEAAEEKKKAKAQKRSEKELLIVTEEPPNEEGQSMSVNVESVTVDNQLTPIPSQSVIEPQSPILETKEEPESSTAIVEEEKPKKKTREEIRKEKEEAKRIKQEEKYALQQKKEQEKQERAQAKIEEKRAKQQQKEDQKRAKIEEAERKKAEKEAAKLAKKNKNVVEEQLLVDNSANVPGPSEEGRHFESTMIIEETIIERHGDAEPEVTVIRTTTEQKDGEEPVTTTVEFSGHEEVLVNSLNELQSTPLIFEQPQPITEEIVIVSNGHHETNGTNGHENGTNGKIDGEVNGYVNKDSTVLKKKSADASANENQLPTEA